MTGLHLANINHKIGDIRLTVEVMHFAAGQLTGIVGPNGAGKTSLLKIAAGLMTPVQGIIGFDDMTDAGQSAFADVQQRARRLAYLPQFQPLAWPMSCRDVVALGRLPHHGDFTNLQAEDWRHVDAALAQCQVEGFATRAIDHLSGGERARVLIARLMASDPQVYLLDEPTQSLDPAAQLAVMGLMQQQAQAGKTVVMVLHDLNLAARFCYQVVIMHNGNPAHMGPPQEVFTPAHLRPIFSVDMASIETPHGRILQTLGAEGQVDNYDADQA